MEDRTELHSYELITLDDFSNPQRALANTGRTMQTPQMQYDFTGGKPDLYSYPVTSREEYRRYLSKLEDVKKEIGTLELSPPSAGGGGHLYNAKAYRPQYRPSRRYRISQL